MTIQWLGHACFTITHKGYTLAIDPYNSDYVVGYPKLRGLKADKLLISGDTLFAGSIGRTDSAWGDYDKEIVSIMDKIMGLDGEVEVIPGHGPKTDIAHERTHNPFLQPFNEPEEDMDWDGEGLNIDGDLQ